MTDKLLPCPFCGGDAFTNGSEEVGFYASCRDCYTCVGEAWDKSAMPDHMFKTEDDAIAAWNRRKSVESASSIDRMDFVAWIRPWVKSRFGKWITHNTAVGAFNDFEAFCNGLNSPAPTTNVDGWTEVPEEPPLGLLRSINRDNQVLAYENGRYYNAWFEFEQSEGGWFWTDDADSEPNPSHYRPLPIEPVVTPEVKL
jgi:Lar family restriction alleviation protein